MIRNHGSESPHSIGRGTGSLVRRKFEPRFMHVQTDRRNSNDLQVQAKQGDGPELAGGPQQVERPYTGRSDNVSSASFESVGQPFLGRNDDDIAVLWCLFSAAL